MSAFWNITRVGLVAGVALLGLSRSNDLSAALSDFTIAQEPLYVRSTQAPLMMLVMSRDEQLFNKAYSDYTDLDGKNGIDTTYNDSFSYAGYFDANLCYQGGISSPFSASRKADGANSHSCGGGLWSGNFLNWVTMTRLDVLRYVLYGGKRVEDTATRTVIERSHVPSDLHAWAKVYTDSTGLLTPHGTSTMTYCNVSLGVDGAPLLRAAAGPYTEWAATEVAQCELGDGTGDSPAGVTQDYVVRVDVCGNSDARESFCRPYGEDAATAYKPAGVLQAYGETGRLRFGLVSGSYGAPRAGGVLRRDIGKLTGNGEDRAACAAGDEINLATGQFCNQTANAPGIINTLDRFKLTQWGTDHKWTDCTPAGIVNRQDPGGKERWYLRNPGADSGTALNCSAWGNPLAEMYAEALRYITGSTSNTAAFAPGSGELAGLPVLTSWTDPYGPFKPERQAGGNSYCANCSVLVLSSGLPSYDSDQIPMIAAMGGNAAETATNQIGVSEGIQGNRYFAGRVGATPLNAALDTHEDYCASFVVPGLAQVRGLCPDTPSMEGSYLIAGLAYKAFTTDMRPGLAGRPAGEKTFVSTYTVALGEDLPKFTIPVGTGAVTLAPLCESNEDPGAGSNPDSSGWKSCFLGSVGVGHKIAKGGTNHVYGRDQLLDGSNPVAGSFTLTWEDSLYGSDHDLDVSTMITYCVGGSCNTPAPDGAGYAICWRSDSGVCDAGGTPSVADDEVLVRVEPLSAQAGFALRAGFNVTGTNDDRVYRDVVIPGHARGSVISTGAPNPVWSKAKVYRFKAGSAQTKGLESPLWYAAKYGNFDDVNKNGIPDSGEWDKKEKGSPDGYFLARDPSKLSVALEEIFAHASKPGKASTSQGGSGLRLSANSFTVGSSFEVSEKTNDWSGDLTAYGVNSNTGEQATQLWKASQKMPSASERTRLWTATRVNDPLGSLAKKFEASSFGTSANEQFAALGLDAKALPGWVGAATPDNASNLFNYLRGDASRERAQGGPWRNRTRAAGKAPLGDIINSNVVLASPRDIYGWNRWSSSTNATYKALSTSYQTFIDARKAADKYFAFAAANDGMLHGFDAVPKTSGGGELFAYIPAASRNGMWALANPGYTHRYLMDGMLALGDAYDATKLGGWASVLVAPAGAGVPSISGLNVTKPGTFDAASVLWELRGTSGSDANGGRFTGIDELGYVLGKPRVVAIKGTTGPRWVAIFGNGINSVSGKAHLFVVDVATGAVLAKVKASDEARNGLMNIAPVALNNQDGLVDAVYAGDMAGNLWKFDLRSTNPALWSVANAGNPLFKAAIEGVKQPITGELVVSRGAGGGTAVYFGTGSFFQNTDASDRSVQTLYAVNDPGSLVASRTRSDLVMQSLSNGGVSSDGAAVRNMTGNRGNGNGWYVDLIEKDATGKPNMNPAGERFFGKPTLQDGKVFFTTFEPLGDVCDTGGRNRLYGMLLGSGGAGLTGLKSTASGTAACTGNCGGITVGNDTSAPLKNTMVMLPQPPESTLECKEGEVCDNNPAPTDTAGREALKARLRANLSECKMILSAGADVPGYELPRACGRQSWRQIR